LENKLTPADSFVVLRKTLLNDNDRYLLTLLYQPIIGSCAINFYFTLWALLNGTILTKEKTHHYLMAVMHLDLEKINQARERLEAIGLLKTFVKEGSVNNYVYELYAPLTPESFLKNPILTASLRKNLGQYEFKKLTDFFSVEEIALTEYQDISKKFADVFQITNYEVSDGDFLDQKVNEIDVDGEINLDLILQGINEDLLNHKLITNDEKRFLKNLALIYNLNDEIFKELIIGSINQYKKIDLIKLRKKCEGFYQYENDGKLPTLAFKKQPENKRSLKTNVDKRNQMIYFFETTTPRDFLFLKNNSTTISKNEQKILSYLLLDLKLNPGVVNVLIDYVLRINDHKLIKNFVETIASQWKRAKIETVSQAMEFAEQEFKKRKNYRTSKKKTENIPDWFDQKVNTKKPDKKEVDQIQKILAEYK